MQINVLDSCLKEPNFTTIQYVCVDLSWQQLLFLLFLLSTLWFKKCVCICYRTNHMSSHWAFFILLGKRHKHSSLRSWSIQRQWDGARIPPFISSSFRVMPLSPLYFGGPRSICELSDMSTIFFSKPSFFLSWTLHKLTTSFKACYVNFPNRIIFFALQMHL